MPQFGAVAAAFGQQPHSGQHHMLPMQFGQAFVPTGKLPDWSTPATTAFPPAPAGQAPLFGGSVAPAPGAFAPSTMTAMPQVQVRFNPATGHPLGQPGSDAAAHAALGAHTPRAMMEKAVSGQPERDVRPTVGRRPSTPHRPAGTRTLPPPSMPSGAERIARWASGRRVWVFWALARLSRPSRAGGGRRPPRAPPSHPPSPSPTASLPQPAYGKSGHTARHRRPRPRGRAAGIASGVVRVARRAPHRVVARHAHPDLRYGMLGKGSAVGKAARRG